MREHPNGRGVSLAEIEGQSLPLRPLSIGVHKVGVQPGGGELRVRDHVCRLGPIRAGRLHRIRLNLSPLYLGGLPGTSKVVYVPPERVIDVCISDRTSDRVEDLDVVDGLGL